MICPHCLKTIEDGASFCPYCNAYVVRAMVPSTPNSCSVRAAVPVFLRMIVRAPNADAPLRVSSPRMRQHPTWQRAARRAFRA